MAEKTFSPVRVRAATSEAAIAQALQMTGASREDIEIEVLEETEKGVTIRIAPIGTFAAKTESPATESPATESPATESPATESPATESPAFETAGFQSSATSEAASAEESTPVVEEEAASALETLPLAESEDAARTGAGSEVETDIELAEGEATIPETSYASAEEIEADEVGSDEAGETSDSTPIASADQEQAGASTPAIREASSEIVEHARALAQEILDHMGLEAEVKAGDLPAWCLPTSHDKSERVRDVPRAFLSIEGEDVGILIGKHGQTLQSFQYLLNLSLNNTTEEEEATSEGVREGGVHVVVDAGEYRGRRAVALERAAREAAERAKRDRHAIRMEPMPGHERRLVHLALYDDKDVSTSSEGREPWRRVIVTPANARGGRSEERGGRYGNDRRNNQERYGQERYGNERRGGRGGYGNRSYGSGAGNSGNSGGGRRSYN